MKKSKRNWLITDYRGKIIYSGSFEEVEKNAKIHKEFRNKYNVKLYNIDNYNVIKTLTKFGDDLQ